MNPSSPGCFIWQNAHCYEVSVQIILTSSIQSGLFLAACGPSVIRVTVEDEENAGTGTVFFAGPSKAMVTCHHVVKDACGIFVHTRRYSSRQVKVVAVDEHHDLALLRFKRSSRNDARLPHLHLADSGLVYPAAEVVGIGYPFGQIEPDARVGFAAGFRVDKMEFTPGGILAPLSQIESYSMFLGPLAIPGCSGGPILATNGQVVSVITRVIPSNQTKAGIPVAIGVPLLWLKELLAANGLL
jgi:S1-C subfamily serine protease